MKSIFAGALVAGSMVLAGCSTNTVGTHQGTGIPTPSISTTNSLANVEVREKVSGKGCANEFLMIFKSGDNKFLEIHGTPGDSPVDKAKAAAAYNALVGNGKLNDDMLVYPVWKITESKTLFGILADDVCAEVTGYRAVVTGFEKTDTVTEPTQKESGADGSSGFFFGLF